MPDRVLVHRTALAVVFEADGGDLVAVHADHLARVLQATPQQDAVACDLDALRALLQWSSLGTCGGPPSYGMALDSLQWALARRDAELTPPADSRYTEALAFVKARGFDTLADYFAAVEPLRMVDVDVDVKVTSTEHNRPRRVLGTFTQLERAQVPLTAAAIEQRLRAWHFHYAQQGNNLVRDDGWKLLASAVAVMVSAAPPEATFTRAELETVLEDLTGVKSCTTRCGHVSCDAVRRVLGATDV